MGTERHETQNMCSSMYYVAEKKQQYLNSMKIVTYYIKWLRLLLANVLVHLQCNQSEPTNWLDVTGIKKGALLTVSNTL